MDNAQWIMDNPSVDGHVSRGAGQALAIGEKRFLTENTESTSRGEG